MAYKYQMCRAQLELDQTQPVDAATNISAINYAANAPTAAGEYQTSMGTAQPTRQQANVVDYSAPSQQPKPRWRHRGQIPAGDNINKYRGGNDDAPDLLTATDGKAYKMMTHKGWAPGRGLGKDGEGTRDFVKLALKFDKKGLKEAPDSEPMNTALAATDAYTLDVSISKSSKKDQALPAGPTIGGDAREKKIKRQPVVIDLTQDDGPVFIDLTGGDDDDVVLDNSSDNGGVPLQNYGSGVALETYNDMMALDNPEQSS